MHKYEFLQDEKSAPMIINYGQLGTCQLLSDRQTRQFYALKLAPKIEVMNDIKCLTRMDHPNIIKVIDHFDHQDNKLIIFEFMPNGDLYTKIQCGELRLHQIPSIFKGICSAVDYIHSNGVIHRNLKSEAILLDAHMLPKLVDFGLAARLTTRKTFCGCYYYMAPEILMGQPYNSKVDVWALGIILYEMFHGVLPFNGDQPQQLLESINKYLESQVEHKKNSPNFLLKWMLTKDPQKRPTVKQVLAHPFMNSKYFPHKEVTPVKNMVKLPGNYVKNRIKNSIRLHQKTQQVYCCYQNDDKMGSKSDYSAKEKLQCKSGVQKNGNHQYDKYSPIQWIGHFIKNKINALLDNQDYQGNHRFSYTVSEKQLI